MGLEWPDPPKRDGEYSCGHFAALVLLAGLGALGTIGYAVKEVLF